MSHAPSTSPALLLSAMALGVGLSTGAAAWTVQETEEGAAVYWTSKTLDVSVQGLEGANRIAVERGFEVWNEVEDCDLHFTLNTDPQNSWTEGTVSFVEEWDAPPDVLGYTLMRIAENGEVMSFEVRIDAAHAIGGGSSDYDLQALVTHEAGHALGLEHSELEDAAMFPTSDQGAVSRRRLHTDDEEGARFLDDQWRASVDLPIQCSSTPGTAASVLLTLLPLCFIRRRGEP